MKNYLASYLNIVKFHGPIRGSRRAVDQFFQVDLYDVLHTTNFSSILVGDEFYKPLEGVTPSAVMHYQPVYTAAVDRPLKHLIKTAPAIGASSTCFVDLGCGRGKALHIAQKRLPHASLLGIDLHPEMIQDAQKHLQCSMANSAQEVVEAFAQSKRCLLQQNVNHVDYRTILSQFDAVIIFNKNSFDRETTQSTLSNIMEAVRETQGEQHNKVLYYIYSNPVFEALFSDYKTLFLMRGWHKNWNSAVYQLTD